MSNRGEQEAEMEHTSEFARQKEFCLAYLRTMNPERAAQESGVGDGYALLGKQAVRERLEKMREAANSQILREDAVRRLAELAFGRANDAAKLALCRGETDPGNLDLSAVAEVKVTDKGGVEIKLIDRIRALEALCLALEDSAGQGTGELFRALAEAADYPAEGSGNDD